MTTELQVPRRHLFITVEGLSGSGKTSVATLLAAAFNGRYYKTPPDLFTPIRSACDERAAPLARYLYYFAGVAQASAEIRAFLNECPVVCDKYLPTVLAYSRAGGAAPDVECGDLILRPDFSFLLEVGDKLRRTRISKRGSVSEKHLAFLQMETDLGVIDHFREMDLVRIDNTSEDPTMARECIVAHIRSQTTAVVP